MSSLYEFLKAKSQLGLSNSECANFLGVNSRTVARWKSGEVAPPKMAILTLSYKIKYGDLD